MNEAKPLSPAEKTALRFLRGYGPLRALDNARLRVDRGHPEITHEVMKMLEGMVEETKDLVREQSDAHLLLRTAQVLRSRDFHGLAEQLEKIGQPLQRHVDETMLLDGLPLYGKRNW